MFVPSRMSVVTVIMASSVAMFAVAFPVNAVDVPSGQGGTAEHRASISGRTESQGRWPVDGQWPILHVPQILSGAESNVVPPFTTLPPPPGWTPDEFLHLASRPLTDPLAPGDDQTLETGRLSSHRNGFFQKLSFSGSWLNRTAEPGFGLAEGSASLTVAVPLPTRDYPMLITSGFDVSSFNGPPAPDLPAQVYGSYIDFLWLPKLTDRWLGILSISPGIYSDFQDVQSDAFRVKGKAVVRYDWIPDRLQVMAGVLYLDRYDVNWLPAGGLIWTPNEDSRYELLFPRPRLAHCIAQSGMHEDWVYLGGEFGGDAWSYRDGPNDWDMMTLRDWRVYLGLQRKRPGGAGHHVEVGYVFSRSIEFRSSRPDYETGGTIMIRAGFDF